MTISRRDFVKQTAAGAAMLAGASTGALYAAAVPPSNPTKQIVAALGSVFIPSKPGDPGYKELEVYGITDFVIQNAVNIPSNQTGGNNQLPTRGESADRSPGLSADTLEAFNAAAKQFFDGKAFLDLDDKQREQYLGLIVEGSKITDEAQRKSLQACYRAARTRILTIYYKNYPENQVKRSAAGDPILKPGDTHQTIWEFETPNTKKIKTAADITGRNPLVSWEEEEELREKAKKTWNRWYDGYFVKLNDSRPPAAAAIKINDGHDYYDVIVLGGGTAGCIVAGRLAERGINPKTGDRLRVAMIEGGDDWTIRDPGIRPGYGGPIRRSKITTIYDGVGPEGEIPGSRYRYDIRTIGSVPLSSEPGDATVLAAAIRYENLKLLGGCSNHYGGTCWIPGDEDFHFYREASGVNWDMGKFGDAIQEIRDMFHATTTPDSWISKESRMWADAGRSLGLEMRYAETSMRNGLGVGGDLSRWDTKGTALPWAYIGLNNGLKVIPNSEVQKILIEKVPGGRPVATGAVYTDKAGASHEVRAARVIVALGVEFTPLLMYRSGYGPKDLLGSKLLVENKNVGQHLTGDCTLRSTAYLAEAVNPPEREMGGGGIWTAMNPRPWGELTVHFRNGGGGAGPVGDYAPGFGWEHKEYMRNGLGERHMTGWASHFGAIPWSWRVLPTGMIERVELDAPRFDARVKEAGEVVRAWSEKLPVKPVKTNFRVFSQPCTGFEPIHRAGTARAGSSPENSVCTSDYDCHDINNLLFTSAATVPRTFFWSMGPTSVNAAYAWRRMIANHFSTGSSTKGFA